MLILCGVMGPASGSAQQASPDRPNVIIINTDDVGYGDLGAYGAQKVQTPNIDKLANQGRRFTDFHSASAVCSPSRYALLTGQYPARIDFWSAVFLRHPLVIDTTQTTIATIMKRAGYATAAIGKWHLGFGETEPVNWSKPLKPGPLELGFDYYFGVPVVNSHPPFVYVRNHKVVGQTDTDPFVYGQKANTRYFDEKFGLNSIGGASAAHARYNDRTVGTTLTKEAVEWIREQADHPFFLYFATTNIHHPFTPAPQFIGSSEAGRYGDFIHELDWMVGRVMQTLTEENLAENTLLILTSDNGGMLNRGGQTAREAGHHQNGPLLGFKFDAWEGGHRVPLIARWPGHIPSGSVSDALLSNVDFPATLAELTNQPLSQREAPDSFSMMPALVQENPAPVRTELVISPWNSKNLALRKGPWMYISGQGGGGFSEPHVGDHSFGGPPAFPFTGQQNSDVINGHLRADAPPAQLYNLQEDPYQHKNIYNQLPDTVRMLQQRLEQLMHHPTPQKNTSR